MINLTENTKTACILGDYDTFTFGTIKIGDNETTKFQDYREFYTELKNNNIAKIHPLEYSDCGRYGKNLLWIRGETNSGKKVSLMGCSGDDGGMIYSYKLLSEHLLSTINKIE